MLFHYIVFPVISCSSQCQLQRSICWWHQSDQQSTIIWEVIVEFERGEIDCTSTQKKYSIAIADQTSQFKFTRYKRWTFFSLKPKQLFLFWSFHWRRNIYRANVMDKLPVGILFDEEDKFIKDSQVYSQVPRTADSHDSCNVFYHTYPLELFALAGD